MNSCNDFYQCVPGSRINFFFLTLMGEKSFRGVMFAVKTESLHHDSYSLNYDTSMDKLYIFAYV